MPGSFSTVIAHMEPPSSRKQAKRVRLGPKRTLLGAPDVLGEPRGADLVPTTPDWPAWVGFMVTTHFDLVSGPFHSPILSGCIVYQPLLTCTIFIRAPANYRVVHLVILNFIKKQGFWYGTDSLTLQYRSVICIRTYKHFENPFENAHWRKVIQMQPLQLCFFWYKCFEQTFEND